MERSHEKYNKSLGCFCNSVIHITDPEFRAEDIKNTWWNLIHMELGTNDEQADWLEDAGWIYTSITISVLY